MAKRVSVDRWLFTVTAILVFVGLVMVFSASAVMAKERYGSPYTFVLRQLFWAVTGIIAMLAAMKFDYKRYKHPAVVFSLLAVTTILLLAVFALDRSHGTHRWIHWGPFSLQPSELAKPALILFLAFFLETRAKNIADWRNTLIPAVVPTLVFLLLIVASPISGPQSRAPESPLRSCSSPEWNCATSDMLSRPRCCRCIFFCFTSLTGATA